MWRFAALSRQPPVRYADVAAPTPLWGICVLEKLVLLGFLVLATTLEATGDALVRMGIAQQGAWLPRGLLFLGGAVLLFGYGFSLNLAPAEFNRVVGLYIATLFVVWQVVSFFSFGAVPTMPVLVGGALIIAGGLIVTFYQPQ